MNYSFTGMILTATANTIYGVTVGPYQNEMLVKLTTLGAGSTVWVGGATVGPSAGYCMGDQESIGLVNSGTIYFYSENNNSEISVLIGLSQ